MNEAFQEVMDNLWIWEIQVGSKGYLVVKSDFSEKSLRTDFKRAWEGVVKQQAIKMRLLREEPEEVDKYRSYPTEWEKLKRLHI